MCDFIGGMDSSFVYPCLLSSYVVSGKLAILLTPVVR